MKTPPIKDIKQYRISDITISTNIRFRNSDEEKNMEKILCTHKLEADFFFGFSTNGNFKHYNVIEFEVINMLQNYFKLKNESIITDRKWGKNQLLSDGVDFFSVCSLVLLVFYAHAVQRHMIQIHSSMIDYRGKGLLFPRPIGHWQDNYGGTLESIQGCSDH